MAFQIGPHTFQLLIGDVPDMTPTVEIIETPGEDGYALREVGTRTPPFEIEATGYYTTQKDCRNAFQGFNDMIAEGPYEFKKDDIDHAVHPTRRRFKVHVLGLAPPRIEKKACIAGTPKLWQMKTVWTLALSPSI